MSDGSKQRRETRLNYNWPVWFAEDYNHILAQGQMIDISSQGAAFTCYADKCPHDGEEITARFSVPSHGPNSDFDLENFIRQGHVCRIEEVSSFVRKVAIQFAEPLPFKPGEIDQIEEQQAVAQIEKPAKTQAETFEEYEVQKQTSQTATVNMHKTDEMIMDEAAAMAKGHTIEIESEEKSELQTS